MSGAEPGGTGCSEPEQGKQSREEGTPQGTLPYRSSFLAAAAEAGLISARGRDCTSGDQHDPHMVDVAVTQASEDQKGCLAAEQLSKASAPLLSSRSSSQTLQRDSMTTTPESV